ASSPEAFFPVIQELPRPIAAMPMDQNGRALLCQECYRHLITQWNNFETSGVPVERRQYSVQTSGSVRAPVIQSQALHIQVTSPDVLSTSRPATGSEVQTLLTTVSTITSNSVITSQSSLKS